MHHFPHIHTPHLKFPSPLNYSTQACFKVSYTKGKCVLKRDHLRGFHFNKNEMVLLSQPGFESGQYRDNYFCVWNLPDPKPQQKIYGFYLMHKDFHGASGDLNKCPCYDHMTVHSHREWPTTLCGGNFHPPNHQWCKRGASLCFYPGGVKYVGELNWLSMGLYNYYYAISCSGTTYSYIP